MPPPLDEPSASESAFPEAPDATETLALVARIRDGDRGAWTELYRRYHDDLLFAVRVHLGTRLRECLESEDVLQSVVLDAFQALPQFEVRAPGGLRAYLNQMVVNKIRARAGYFGAQKRSGGVPLTADVEDAAGEGPAPSYAEPERYERLERCLARLPEEMARVLVLRRVDGLSSKEAAAVLGKSDAAVRKLYSRALARLTALMAE